LGFATTAEFKIVGNVKKRVDPLTKGGCDEVDYTVAFTPKGGCLLKREIQIHVYLLLSGVAFTPKGGCPLKLPAPHGRTRGGGVAFTPKGGCPLKLSPPRRPA
jgi:hypothetical protein